MLSFLLPPPTWSGKEGVYPGYWGPAVAVPGPHLHLIDAARLEVPDEVGLLEPELLVCITQRVGLAGTNSAGSV